MLAVRQSTIWKPQPQAQLLDLFAWCVRLSRLLVGLRMHFKSLHFYFSFIYSFTAT